VSRPAASATFERSSTVVREILPLGIQALQPRSPGFGPRTQVRHILTTAGQRPAPPLPATFASAGSSLFRASAAFAAIPPTTFANPDQLFTLFGREKLANRQHRLQTVLPLP